MRIISIFKTGAAIAMLFASMLVAVAPASAAAEDQLFLVSVLSDGPVTAVPANAAALAGKPAQSQVVVLPGRTTAGVATDIVCYVYGWGPELNNQVVRFEIMLLCQNGVPALLNATLDIYHIYAGSWAVAPGSHTPCGSISSPVLDNCVATTPCWQAGNYYYGYGFLSAFDDLGALHEAEVWTNPAWIGCII